MYFALQFVDILARGIILVSLNVPRDIDIEKWSLEIQLNFQVSLLYIYVSECTKYVQKST